MLSTFPYLKQALTLSAQRSSAGMLLKPCSQVQVGTRGQGHYVQCRRIMSDLLPAAELLLRGVMDLRHTLWHKNALQPSGRTAQMAVEEARCTGTWLRLKSARRCLFLLCHAIAVTSCSWRRSLVARSVT